MKAAERWEAYRRHQDTAHELYAAGQYRSSWYRLLLAEQVNWTSSSPKQQKQRQLASELWRITGVIGQLRLLGVKNSYALGIALEHCQLYESIIRNEMKNIWMMD